MVHKHTQWRWINIVLLFVLLIIPVITCAMEQQEEVRIDGMNLIEASECGQMDKVNFLIRGGADINAVDKDGYTALIEASRNGYKKIVDSLIKGGADINAGGEHGYTALILASINGYNSRSKKVVDSLIAGGAHINAADKNGDTALIKASYHDYKEIVDSLIKAGANPYIKNNDGKNSLDVAKNNDEELKKHIIKEREKYVIKKYKEYLIDGKNRIENLAGLLQEGYAWYKPYSDENKGNNDEHNLHEVKKSYYFPKDIAGVIARMMYGISDDEWAQMRRLENEQQSSQ